MENTTGMVISGRVNTPAIFNNNAKSVVVRQNTDVSGGEGYVEHIGLDDVIRVREAAAQGQNGERDSLLIGLLFDSCLRISELLELTPKRIDRFANRIKAKNLKRPKGKSETSWVGISESIKNELIAYIWSKRIPDNERVFPFSRFRAHQILSQAMADAGITQPEHTGRVHIMRHSGAIALLERTGNIQMVRGQLRHSQIRQSMNYLKTYARDEAVRAKGNIDMWSTPGRY